MPETLLALLFRPEAETLETAGSVKGIVPPFAGVCSEFQTSDETKMATQ